MAGIIRKLLKVGSTAKKKKQRHKIFNKGDFMKVIISLLIFACCAFISGVFSWQAYYEHKYNAYNLIEKCGKELPRTQKCVIVAVPEENIDE